MTKDEAIKQRFWIWVGSASYWKSAAVITAILLTIATLLKTGDWIFTAAMLWGFYTFWKFAELATKAAPPQENT